MIQLWRKISEYSCFFHTYTGQYLGFEVAFTVRFERGAL